MKLLKLWNSYKSEKRRSRRCNYTFLKNLTFPITNIFLVLILVLFGGCEEQLPTLQNSINPLAIDTLVMRALPRDSLNFAQGFTEPSLGQSGVLYVGNDANVFAYTMLKFSNFANLPDSIASFVSLSLSLKSYHQYQTDGNDFPAVDIGIYWLKNDGVDPWTEDSSNVSNFDIADFSLDLLGTFTFSDTDTVVIDLDTTLISEWYNGTTEDYTLVLMQVDTSQASIQSFYSDETSLYPWLEIDYPYGDTTVTTLITPEEDLAILKFKQAVDTQTRFNISAGRSSFSFLKFEFEDSLSDENRIIAKADLELKIDRAQSQLYGELFNLYVTLVDTAVIDDQGEFDPRYNPKDKAYDSYQSISSSADSVVVSLKSLLQGVTSDYIENYGLVLWATPGNSNISTLTLYNESDQNPINFRPVLRVLTFKEQ